MKWALLTAVCAILLGGCSGRKASLHASGSGYGVGVPRVNLMFGKDVYAKGPALSFRHEHVEEGRDYRPARRASFPARWGVTFKTLGTPPSPGTGQ